MFSMYDANKDGVLSGAEVVRGPLQFVSAPDLTYTDRININLGGKRAEVIHMPTVHADDNTIVRFIDGSNVLFASDWITVHRLPFGPITPDEMDNVKKVEAMDFEYFICSHGRLGKKSDVSANLHYREKLTRCRSQIHRRRTNARASPSRHPHGRLQGLGILRRPAPAERRRHLSRASQAVKPAERSFVDLTQPRLRRDAFIEPAVVEVDHEQFPRMRHPRFPCAPPRAPA